MADTFINLSCANCGAKPAVYDDMERFACRYCGTEMMVQRRDDTVALKAVTAVLQRVEAGTDKTAAELAIVRLEKELAHDRLREHQLLAVHDRAVGRPICLGALLLVSGSILIFSVRGALVAGAVFIMAGMAAMVYGWRREPSGQLVDLRTAIQKTEQRLAEAKAVVEG